MHAPGIPGAPGAPGAPAAPLWAGGDCAMGANASGRLCLRVSLTPPSSCCFRPGLVTVVVATQICQHHLPVSFNLTCTLKSGPFIKLTPVFPCEWASYILHLFYWCSQAFRALIVTNTPLCIWSTPWHPVSHQSVTHDASPREQDRFVSCWRSWNSPCLPIACRPGISGGWETYWNLSI